jgi:ubiquinone/menaquinone biosynthesis C-methylase UbiE
MLAELRNAVNGGLTGSSALGDGGGVTTPPTPEQRKQWLAGLYDRAAPTYEDVGVDYFTTFGRELVERTGLRPGEHVLDLGCGRGAATFPAAEAVGRDGRVLGLDLSPAMVERCAAAARERGLDRVDVRVGDAEAPDLPAGSTFDALLASFVVFFLPDQAAALRRWRALLPEGGRLGLATFPPQPESRWAQVATVVRRYLTDPPVTARPDENPLAEPAALASALRDAGFADVTSTTETFDTAFRDLDQWWAWAWSHGQRGALERIPADRLDEAKAELYDHLRPAAEPDGSLRLRQLVTFTVATA